MSESETPVLVKTWDELAAALAMDVRTLRRTRKLPGTPAGLVVAEWKEYFAQASSVTLEGLTPTTYDGAISKGGLDLEQALQHSRLVEQEIINERRREELKKVRGDTLTHDEHRRRLSFLVETLLRTLESLPELAAAGLPIDEQAPARKRARTWIDALREKAAEALRLAGG